MSSIVTVAAILAQSVLSLCGIRFGYILVMMLCGTLAFLNANKLLDVILKLRKSRIMVWLGFVGCAGLFLAFWWLVCKDVIVVGTPVCYYSTIPVAILVAVIAFAIPAKIQRMPVVAFVSSISYEVYLVHAAMLIWVKPVSTSNAVYAALFLLGTFTMAIPLHYASFNLIKHVTGRAE